MNTQTVSTDNGMLREFTNLGTIKYLGTFCGNQTECMTLECVPLMTYHQIVPAVNVKPGYTVPPITRPRGYLKQQQQKKSAIICLDIPFYIVVVQY